jgi:hypothetical protein
MNQAYIEMLLAMTLLLVQPHALVEFDVWRYQWILDLPKPENIGKENKHSKESSSSLSGIDISGWHVISEQQRRIIQMCSALKVVWNEFSHEANNPFSTSWGSTLANFKTSEDQK